MKAHRRERLDQLCGTCANWAQGASYNSMDPVIIDEDAVVGACMLWPPSMLMTGIGTAISVNPMTHETRTCESWLSDYDPASDGDPDPAAAPKPARVTHLRAVSTEKERAA